MSSQGARDLHAALLRLALTVDETAKAKSLWIYIPKMTISRVRDEWNAFRRVVDQTRIVPQISMVAMTSDGIWSSSNSAELEEKARVQLPGLARARLPATETRWMTVSAKFFEVWKVLLQAWLLREGPIAALEISKRSGASIPTVAAALRHFRQRGEVPDTRNRPMGLARAPAHNAPGSPRALQQPTSTDALSRRVRATAKYGEPAPPSHGRGARWPRHGRRCRSQTLRP